MLPARDPDDRSPSPLYLQLRKQAEAALDHREEQYEQLKSAEQIRAWQQRRRELFLAALGEFPPRGPLHAQTVGQLEGDGFRVEKVIFESRPQHHITANLYLPATAPPYPGVIVPCGHSYNGKAADGYQRVSMLLARHGIAALCYDPIGQGERYQTMGPDGVPHGSDYVGGSSSVKQLSVIPGQPRFNPVEEHTLVGIGSILVGTNAAQYRVFDGMRAIDYLASRPEIDPQRIGCTGNSGGGTLTAYLMALDDRVACAAPTCYLTTFRRLLHTSGPQDAEQNLFGQLEQGLDEADYVLMRAPKPTVLCGGTRDATFDITGTWDILREAKRVYTKLGFPERVDLVEADEPHGFTLPLRVGAARWLRRWLLHIDEPIEEPAWTPFAAEQLQCTPQGQVMQLPGELSVFQLNHRRGEELAAARQQRWQPASRAAALQRVRELARIRPLADLPVLAVHKVATVERPTYRVDKLRFDTDRQLSLPALHYVPRQNATRRILVLHSAGKLAAVEASEEIEKWAESGAAVLAIDLSGLGELSVRGPREWGGTLFGPNTQEFFLAYLLGQSLVGIRAEEILGAARWLGEQPAASPRTAGVEVVATGAAAGVPLLHAAALEPDLFSRIEERSSLSDWMTVVGSPVAGDQLTHTVHAALTAYDLPQLRAAIPREKWATP
ncbi:MAG: alpha/beta hydrolase family protein [Pirellulaceae bacterium]